MNEIRHCEKAEGRRVSLRPGARRYAGVRDVAAEREPAWRPSLEQLLAACEGPVVLICTAEKTMAIQGEHVVTGDTPAEAAALLWLVQGAGVKGSLLQ
jgi:hypothetical protein